MDSCRTTLKHADCGGELVTQSKNKYEPFDVCLPFGRTLHWDGQGLRISGRVSLPDGKYGVVTVTNGCITDAEEQPVCEYTPQPCTPAAVGCGGEGEASVVLDPSASNLLKFDALGRLGASLNYRGVDGIIISGYGTAESPLVISYDGGEAAKTYLRQGNLAVTVTGDGTIDTPYTVTHRESPLDAGTYNGITVDDFGHISAISTISGAITDILSTSLSVSSTGSIYTINLEQQAGLGDYYQMGAYNVRVDSTGIIRMADRNIVLPDGLDDIDPVANYLTINEFGSVTAVTPHAVVAGDQFCEFFNGPRAESAIMITTRKNGHFKITYRGQLKHATAPSGTVNGSFIPLPRPYSVMIGNRAVQAYAVFNGSVITEVVALTDALYGAGPYTIQIADATSQESPYLFDDIGFITVELVGRGDEA